MVEFYGPKLRPFFRARPEELSPVQVSSIVKDTLVVDDSWDNPGGAGEQQEEAGGTREERLAVECTRLQAAYQVGNLVFSVFSVC